MTSALVLVHGAIASMVAPHRGSGDGAVGLIEDGALVIEAGKIVWVGRSAELPRQWHSAASQDLQGRLVTPGLIDCHTHLIYAGDRAHEWQRRLEGESYASIARSGGGIVSSVKATRLASEQELVTLTAARLANWLAEGVTTVEIKSGYGLSLEHELKMLRAARRLGRELPVRVVTTFLGAHALPEEFKQRPREYLDLVIDSMLPAIAAEGLADAVDIFVEKIAFTAEDGARLFTAAKALGISLKVHADQLSDSGGSALAAQFSALSADHLEYTKSGSVEAMAKAGVVAVLLPAAFYSMQEKQLPPVDAFRTAGVPMAIATDHNPGTSPCSSLLLVLNLACNLFRLTVEEALLAVTCNAARALGLDQQTGSLKAGLSADLAIWEVAHVRDLCYGFGQRPLAASMLAGHWTKPLQP